MDSSLAYKRHFPAINWLNSYSLYLDGMEEYFNENVDPGWSELRQRIMRLLQEEAELEEIVKLVGMDAVSAQDRLKLETARSIREDYLHQNAFDDTDTYTSLQKQRFMMQAILDLYDASNKALAQGASVNDLVALPCREAIGRFKYVKEDETEAEFETIETRISEECKKAVSRREDF